MTEPSPSHAPGMGLGALVGSHLAFVPAGAAVALYGPSLPELAARYALSSGEVGLVIGAHSTATLLGILAWALAGTRPHPGTVSGAGAATLGAGLLSVALAPSWPLTLLGAALTGAGFGATVVGLNLWAARAYDRHRVTVLATMSAVFGVGAVGGPALVGAVGPEAFGVAFAAFGLLALASGASLVLVGVRTPAPAVPPPSALASRGRLPLMVGFMIALGLYVGTEAGIAGWLATHLVGLGHSPEAAASWTAGFWIVFTIGRGAGAPLAHRIAEQRLVPALFAAGALTLVLSAVPGLAVAGYLLSGAALALVFPALLSWFTRVFGQPPAAVALLFAAGSVGSALLPPGIGALVDLGGVGVIPWSLAAAATIACALSLGLGRRVAAARAVPTPSPTS
ncbi:MAG: MFS transporter [Egibacteraceae bacterium]